MKKVLALVLAVMMLATVAFAAELNKYGCDDVSSKASKTAITSSLNRKENRDDSKRIKTGTHNSGESRIDGKGTPQNPF